MIGDVPDDLRRTALAVGQVDAQQSVDPPYPQRQAADGVVTGLGAKQRRRFIVIGDMRDDLIDESLLTSQATHELGGDRDAGLLVAQRTPPSFSHDGGHGLTEVMAQYGEADDQVFARIADLLLRKGVHAVQGMRPDAAFRMPDRVLRDIDDGGQLGEILQPSALAQELQSQRRFAALQDQLRPLLIQALGRQVVRMQGRADGDGFWRDREFKARGELHGAQDAQRIFGELRRDMADHARLQIAFSLIEIQ